MPNLWVLSEMSEVGLILVFPIFFHPVCLMRAKKRTSWRLLEGSLLSRWQTFDVQIHAELCNRISPCVCVWGVGYVWLSDVVYSNTEWMLLQDIT